MIDYEKIKLAYALAYKYSEQTQSVVRISISISYALGDFCCALSTAFGGEKSYSNIDEIVSVLQELTKPKCKYEVGSTWWYLDEAEFLSYPKPRYLKITEESKNWYRNDEEWFPSREALIEAQIEYWASMKPSIKEFTDEEFVNFMIKAPFDVEECKHESDGLDYLSNPPKTRCKKCGEFY